MKLYMIELAVRDLDATAQWYSSVLQYRIALEDQARGFMLLRCEASDVAIALKQTEKTASSTLLHFQVTRIVAERERLERLGVTPLDDGKTSDEGYTRLRYVDPDGHAVVLFQWDHR